MRTSKKVSGFGQTAIALAVLAAFAPAKAQAQVAQETTIQLGAGLVSGDSKDRARFGMFNGLRDNEVNPLLGFTYFNSDSASGRWNSAQGRNLGLDNQEFGLSFRKLGDWKFSADYSEITRHDPRSVNTAMQGAGTTTPTIVLLPTPGTGQDLDFELKRKAISLAGSKWLSSSLQVELGFKNEDKDGTRLFGRGFSCPATGTGAPAPAPAFNCDALAAGVSQFGILIVPEPVNSNIKQIDAKLNWTAGRMFLSGAYYGSFYTNSPGNVTPTIPATLNNPLGAPTALGSGLRTILGLPVALWPDNDAHQVSLAGKYAFTRSTSINFKYSFSRWTQNESFLGMGLTGAPAGRADLGGQVDRQKFMLGFSTHPLQKLHVHGDIKFDDRKDKTPVAFYNTEFNSGAARFFTNAPYSPKKADAKLEAAYKLPANYTAVAAVFYETEDVGTTVPATASLAGLSGIRQKMKEQGLRLELRKTLSEVLNGSVSYTGSKKEGDSPWLKPLALPSLGVIEASPDCQSVGANACIYNRTAIFPFIFMDRKKEKLRATANWAPADRLDFTFFVENGYEKYAAPTDSGLRSTNSVMLSGDVAYKLSDAWRLTGYLSHGQQRTNAGHSTGYDATLKDTNNSAGVALLGRFSERVRMGADLNYLNDVLKYEQVHDAFATAANRLFLAEQGGLPDVTYRLVTLKVFGEFAFQRNSSVRLDYVHHRSFFNEWTYNFNGVPYLFSDNTTITAKQYQNVNFLGASYIHRFQ